MSKGLWLVIPAFAISLGLAEGALRASGYHYRTIAMKLDDGRIADWRPVHAFEQPFLEFDPETFWRPKPGAKPFNSQGLRGREIAPAASPGRAPVVLAIGDSNVAGHPKKGGSWPEYLEELGKDRFVVANAGVWGYTSFQGLGRLKSLMELRPSVVLISFGCNEAHRGTVSDREYLSTGLLRMRWLRGLRLGQLLAATQDRVRGLVSKTERVPRVSAEEHAAQLRGMIRLARRDGASPVLLTRPYQLASNVDPEWWSRFGADYRSAAIAVARDEGVPLIDVYDQFKGRPGLFADDAHFTDEGSREMAAWLLPRILELLSSSEPS